MGKITDKMTEVRANIRRMKEHLKKGVFGYSDAYVYWKALKAQEPEFNTLVQNWMANGSKTSALGGAQAKLDMINNFTRKWREFRDKHATFWNNPKTKRLFG